MTFAGKLAIASLAAIACFALGGISRPSIQSLRDRLTHNPAASPGLPRDPTHYQRRHSLFKTLGHTEPIVFLGDSRMELASWSELLGRSDISNRGINGDTTTGLLARLDVSTSPETSTYVLQIGVNDLSSDITPEAVATNVDTITARLLERPDTAVILTSIVHTTGTSAHLNGKISEANKLLAGIAKGRNVTWLNLDPTLSPDGTLEERFTTDGIHLSGEGYRRFSGLVAPLLSPALTAGK